MAEGGVVVVGSVNVDLMVRTDRLPAPGETVIGGTFHRSPGGKGANAAAAAARLGGRTWMVGLVGPDAFGEEARRDLEAAGVDPALLDTGTGPTGVAVILVDHEGQNLIAVASGTNAELTDSHVRRALTRVGTGHAVVLANLEVPDRAVAAAAEASTERGWPFVLNAAPGRALSADILGRSTVVVANEIEATTLGGAAGILGAGAGSVVVTRGAAGADLHRRGRPPRHQPAFPVAARDSTGAGDAFAATVAWALLEGRPMEDAVRLAAAAGALACRGLGARGALPDRSELEHLASNQA
jgi:ribokinase